MQHYIFAFVHPYTDHLLLICKIVNHLIRIRLYPHESYVNGRKDKCWMFIVIENSIRNSKYTQLVFEIFNNSHANIDGFSKTTSIIYQKFFQNDGLSNEHSLLKHENKSPSKVVINSLLNKKKFISTYSEENIRFADN